MQDTEKTTTHVPISVMLLSILDAIFCGEEKMSWELHIIVKSLVDPKDREVKRRVRPILEWMIWICMKGRNKDTSAAETDMTVVTLPSQKLKSWQKLWLEGTVGKWPEARRVSATQINAISEVAVAASLSVSQVESFFVRGSNTAMKMNGAIAVDSATGRNKFTARQRAALIGFCGVETRKQIQKNWKQIKKARDATEVCTILVTTIK